MKYYRLQQQPNKLKSNKHPAFTLIELTIILAIITLIAALCIPLMMHHQSAVTAEAEALRSTLWYLQQHARAQNKQITLTFNETDNSYISDIENHKLSRQVKFGILSDVLGPPSAPHKRLTTAITFPDKKITINPNGSMQAGTIYLIDVPQKFLYAVTVPIAGVAYIRIYHYRNKQWHVYR